MQENRRNGREEGDIVATIESYIPLRKNRNCETAFLVNLTNFRWFSVFLNFFSYKAVFIVNVINIQRLISRIKFLPQSLLLSPVAKIWIGCVWMRSVH